MSAPVPPNRSNQKAPGGLTSSIPPYDGRITHAGSIYGSCFRRLHHPSSYLESIKQPVQRTQRPTSSRCLDRYVATVDGQCLSSDPLLPQSIPSSVYGTITHMDLHYRPTTHLSPTLHAPTTTATLGSLGPTSGMPFPRLFSSCLSPARKTPTCFKFWTWQIHVLKVPLRALASETCYPPSDATTAVGLLFKGGMAVCHDPYSECSDVVGRKVNILKSTNRQGHGCKVKAFPNIGRLT